MADYPITAVTRRKVYSGSAGVGPYAFTFPILVQTDIVVYKNAALLTLTTDYSVTINGTNGTGSVTLVSPATGADTITIIGARAIQRTTDFVTAGDLAASSLNEQLDGNIIMTQQLAEENKRTLRAPPYDPEATVDGGTLNMTLPAKADRAGKLLGFDSNGNPSASALNLPTTITALNYVRGNSGATAYEFRSPANVRSDIGADNASNLTSGTIPDARLPSTFDSKTLTNVTISSGSISGITDLAIADGGTGASSASGARSNLGLVIGTDVQAYDPQLADIAGLTPTDNNFIVGNGTNFVTESGATARASLGLSIGSDVQAYDPQLADIAGLTPSDNNFIVGNGTNFVTESGATARTSLGLGSIATQDASNVSITGGSISGVSFSLATPVTVPGTASSTGEIRLAEDTDNGTNYVGLKAPASISADISWTLPAADGTSGQFLSTNGSGTLSWSSPAGAGDVVGPASSTDNAIVRFDSTSGKAIQNSGVTIADDNATVISGSSTSAMLRVTQTGTGNALVVEDETNPDGTPFVVNADGRVGIGTSSPASDALLSLGSAQGSSQTIFLNGFGTDADASIGNTNGAITFRNSTASQTSVAALTERMRIDNAGQVRIGAGSAGAPALSVLDDTNTGIFFPAADTVAIAAAGTEDFRIGPAGQIGIQGANYGTSGQVLTSGGASAAPSWATPAAGGFSNMRVFQYQTGTYTRTGTLVTCTVTAHGLTTNDSVVIDFITGGALDGTYVVTVTGANTFTLNTAASGTIASSNMAITGYDWVIPAGITKVKATVVGGGGGSGATASGSTGGGGGGGSAIRIVSGLTPGNTVTASVGAGGAGGATTSGNGSAGGTSSFGSHCSATGGAASNGVGTITGSAGGLGGIGSLGDINIRGGGGSDGRAFEISATTYIGSIGAGGSSILGGGAPGNTAGSVFGGGAGGRTSGAGSAGAAGVVMVEW